MHYEVGYQTELFRLSLVLDQTYIDYLIDKTKRLLSLENLCKLGLILKFSLIQKDYVFIKSPNETGK